MFKLKRAYDLPASEDGVRILVDRRWPCRVYKKDARIDLWLKEIAPSEALTNWFQRDPAKWEEFRRRYREELLAREAQVQLLEEKGCEGTVTLVYRARDTRHNNALALLEYLEQRAATRAMKKAA